MRKIDIILVTLQIVILGILFVLQLNLKKLSNNTVLVSPLHSESSSSGVCIECPGTKEHLTF